MFYHHVSTRNARHAWYAWNVNAIHGNHGSHAWYADDRQVHPRKQVVTGGGFLQIPVFREGL